MPIHQITETTWVLETAHSGYALGFNASGRLCHCYWGPRLASASDYPPAADPAAWASFDGPAQLTPEEYPVYGGISYVDPCLKATFADGTRDVVLRFHSAEITSESEPELQIRLRDAYYPLHIILHYRVYEQYDLIERWVTLANQGDSPITLERVWSAQWHLPPYQDYYLTHLTGRWADEMHVRREQLTEGLKVLESRRLTTSHHHNPWFAVDRGNTDEDEGDVWFGVLAWSGNWKLSAEVTNFASTRISLGLNDWDFAWRLGTGEQFTTPSSYAGYTSGGFGAASRILHDFIRHALLPHGTTLHPVLYNSWYVTHRDINASSQIELARSAAAIGAELFVVDAGWFSNSGKGDWQPDPLRFPQGLTPLIEHVNALGMGFGLWVEPEMVNPDSGLYHDHPDWVIHFPTRTRTIAHQELILNLGRTDVQDYLIELLDHLLTEYKIAYVKWDMNRNVSEPGWPGAPGDPREIWVRYVHGLYRVWETLRNRHPAVLWESCSGGGGRVDLGVLHLADQIWVSDNTEATARLCIQEGFSYIFPASTMEAWVTDQGQDYLSLDFRFHASMCGSLGISVHPDRWSEEERARAARWIGLYKEIRPIVQLGGQYRLRSPQHHSFSALQYVAKDRSESILFAFRTHLPEAATLPLLYLRGLDPAAHYEVEGISGIRSGASWMYSGLELHLHNFESTVRRIRRVEM